MKKIMQSMGMRVLSCLLCTICILVLAVSAVASVFYAEMQTEAYTYKNGAQEIADSYALYTLQYVSDNQSMDEVEEFLAKHDIRCEIIVHEQQGKNVSSKVLYSNADKDTEWMYQTEVAKGTVFRYQLSSMWSALGNSDYYEPDSGWKEFIIQDYVYDEARGIFYYKTEVGYFPIEDIYVIYKDDTLNCDYTLKIFDGKQCYYNNYYDTALDISKYHTWKAIEIDGALQLSMDEIEIITNASVIEKNICKATGSYDPHGMSDAIYTDYNGPVDSYSIQIGWNKESIAANYFTEWNEACSFLYTFQNNLVAIVVSAFLLFLFSFVVMIYSTIEEKEKLGILHRVPVGMYSAVIFCMEYVLIFATMQGTGEFLYNGIIQMDMAYCVLALLVFVIVLLAVIYVQNIITRFRSKSFLRYSELHYAIKIVKVLWEILKQITIVPLRKIKRAIQENTSIIVRGFGILIGLSILEFVLFACSNFHGEIMMIWIVIGKCIEIPIILFVLIQMKKLQEGAKRIASGDLSTPIDTKKMYWEFKRHGENINNVSQSIRLAVEEQMKSERFKTELITNVSHDIKTPLTSIINYVDLIKKEDITDEKLCEYVEVLDRQSARLKKLIEDLMEASKASTGNLVVHLEECDVEVLLTQIIGEFEERLQNNQLEVVVAKPEHPVKIQTDGRHMWRVLDNLLGNACKYAMPNTRVYVSLEQQGKEVVIVFKNISKAALNIPSEELMERFVRGDSSRNTEGSGLGLSIAQSLTELMHGTMKLDIDGDLFKVTLRFPI